MRIVSLISSGTEILCELGLGDRLVGISHECDYPASIRGLPVVSEPKVNPALRGAAIDAQVRSLVRDGLSVYRIKTELLAELAPDLIVTQDQCEVCAVSLKDVEEAVCALTLKKTRIVSLRPDTLTDIADDFRRVGAACGVPERAEALVDRFRERLARVAATVEPERKIPRVALLEWLEPPIVAGGWMPEIARLAGAVPVIVGEPGPFRKVHWEEVQVANPDFVLILPCGYPIAKTLSELVDSTLGELIQIPAVREGGAYVCDGNSFFNRAGPRIADSAEILAAIFHPDRCAAYRAAHRDAFVPWIVT